MSMMEIIITRHAMERFEQRNVHSDVGNNDPEKMVRKLLDRAYEIEFSKEHRIKRLLSNDFQNSRYFYNNGLIFVCTDTDPMHLVTIEGQGTRKFGRDLFKKVNEVMH